MTNDAMPFLTPIPNRTARHPRWLAISGMTGWKPIPRKRTTAWFVTVAAFAAVFCLLASSRPSSAGLRDRIDVIVARQAAAAKLPLAPATSDAVFVRRLFLDLTGRIPTAAQTRAFVEDDRADKRTKLVDRLLRSPEHVRHLQHWLDVLLMRRQTAKHVPQKDWQQYLYTALRENRSWETISRELLSTDGTDSEHRAAARFLLDRELKREETTRAIGQIFLGRDLQCAQCHDHPHIGDYRQQHYYGLAAFLNRSYLFKDPTLKKTVIAEKAVGTVKFTSVFTSEEGETPPRVLELPPLDEPAPKSVKQPYLTKPDKKHGGVPRHSRFRQLAPMILSWENKSFRLNVANRIWALLMGRGLVEPLDMFHSDNPPSHPELLELLADDLQTHGFNLRRAIREIVSTQTYARSRRGDALDAQRMYASATVKPLTPEQLAWSVMQATGVVSMTRVEVVSQIEKKNSAPKPGSGKRAAADPQELAFRIEQSVNDKLAQHVTQFVDVFASKNESSRFDATAKQALFMMNDPLLDSWLAPREGNLVGDVLKLDNSQAVVARIFLSVYCRLPDEGERSAAVALLDGFGTQRSAAVRGLVKAMLCSAEFRFNH